MKEFEKKWNRLGVDVPRDVERDEAIARGYWKAALEWILKEGIDDWIEDTIRKELRG